MVGGRKSILIATRQSEDAQRIENAIRHDFSVTVVYSPEDYAESDGSWDLVLLDHNFTPNAGIDFLMEILKRHYVPVLMLTPHDDPQCAVESMRSGAFNYIVKYGDFEQVIPISINEAIEKFNEREQMKQTIVELKNRILELEKRLGIQEKAAKPQPAKKPVVGEKETAPQTPTLIQEIIERFRKGEINLPSMPKVNLRFRELIKKGASLKEVCELLKQDQAISSKLISVSNTAFYRGMKTNTTVDQAVNRLGLGVTRQFVDVISNRSLYTTANEKYAAWIERLWGHSLACAYASQTVSEVLGADLEADSFTLGLLHDIGKLVLLQVVGELEVKGKFANGIGEDQLASTVAMFHGRFGAVLMKRWDFPEVFEEVALHHDDPGKVTSGSRSLLTVNFANLLVKSLGFDDHADPGTADPMDSEAAALLNITPPLGEEILSRLKERVEGVKGVLL